MRGFATAVALRVYGPTSRHNIRHSGYFASVGSFSPQMAESAANFQITQFGLSAFEWDRDQWVARTWNFYIFPRPSEGQDRRFLCQVLFVPSFATRSGDAAVADLQQQPCKQQIYCHLWTRRHSWLEATAHKQRLLLWSAGWQHGLPRSAGLRLQQVDPQRNPLPPGRRARHQASASNPTITRSTTTPSPRSATVHRVRLSSSDIIRQPGCFKYRAAHLAAALRSDC